MTRSSWRRVVKPLTGGVGSLILLWLFLRWFEQRQVFWPSRRMEAAPAQWGWAFEDVALTTQDAVRIHGWFLPAPASSPRARLALILFHGNAGNLSHRRDVLDLLRDTGANVLAIDYRGYGRSKGRPTELGTYLDAEAAHRWLVEKGFAATNLIALGESLGCAVATELACRQTLGGLILQSGFTSVPDLGAELFPWLPVRQIGRIRYDTRSKLPRLTVPVLILHSPDDELIGFHHAQRNYAVAREPKWLWELRGGHNDALWVDRARFRAGLEMFLARFAEGTNPRPRMTHNE